MQAIFQIFHYQDIQIESQQYYRGQRFTEERISSMYIDYLPSIYPASRRAAARCTCGVQQNKQTGRQHNNLNTQEFINLKVQISGLMRPAKSSTFVNKMGKKYLTLTTG